MRFIRLGPTVTSHSLGKLIEWKPETLTLLPTEINSFAGHKQWIEKWIYYRHLSEKDPDKLDKLKQEAKKNGVNLKDSTINLLKNVSHKSHIEPIVQLGVAGQWDKSFCQ